MVEPIVSAEAHLMGVSPTSLFRSDEEVFLFEESMQPVAPEDQTRQRERAVKELLRF